MIVLQFIPKSDILVDVILTTTNVFVNLNWGILRHLKNVKVCYLL